MARNKTEHPNLPTFTECIEQATTLAADTEDLEALKTMMTQIEALQEQLEEQIEDFNANAKEDREDD